VSSVVSSVLLLLLILNERRVVWWVIECVFRIMMANVVQDSPRCLKTRSLKHTQKKALSYYFPFTNYWGRWHRKHAFHHVFGEHVGCYCAA